MVEHLRTRCQLAIFKIKVNVLGRVVLETLDGFCCYLLLETIEGKPGDLVALTDDQVRGLVKIEVLNEPD